MTTAMLTQPEPAVTRQMADAGEVAARVCDTLGPLAESRRVQLTCQTVPGCRTAVDAARLEEVLTMLVRDAIMASEWEEHVLVRTASVAGIAHVDIVSSGAGARHRAGRIIEPFLRDAPARPASPLRQARLLLEQAGGRLRTSSDLGRSATFTVIAPRRLNREGELLV